MIANELHDLGNYIVSGMGDGWRYEKNESWRGERGNIIREDGALLILDTTTGIGKRLIITGTMGDKANYVPNEFYDRRFQITVSESKSFDAILKQIKSRLLPDYLKVYAEAVKIKKRFDEERERQEYIARELAGLAGTEPLERDATRFISYNPKRIEASVDGSTVRMELVELTVEQAEHIIKYLRNQ